MDNDIKTWLYDILQSIKEVRVTIQINPRNLRNTFLTSKQKGQLKEISKSLEKQ